MSGGPHPLDSVLLDLVAHVESDPGREVCGFVLGGMGAGAPEIVQVRNSAEEPARTFRMDPSDVLAVLRRADGGAGIAAMYHSHPSGGASLSERDLAELTIEGGPLLPGVELWVVGMATGRVADIRGYRWIEGGYREVIRRRGPFTL